MATTNPFDVGNTNAPANQAKTFQAVTSQVDKPTETVSGQLQGIMAQDNPLMQQARTQATQGMAARGLVNSSINQGAGVAAMLDRAIPIATADANTFSNRALTNTNNQNTVGMSNTQAANQFGLLGNQQAFTAAQSQLDRAQQTALTDKSVEATANLAKAQQNFDAAQNSLSREQQTSLQTSQQTFAAGQSALDRTQQTDLANAAQASQATQAEKDRAAQLMLADKSITATQALEKSRQEATAAQAELDRSQQTTLATAQQTFAGTQAALDRANQVALADKSIAATTALETARQTFASAQAALDRIQQTDLQTNANVAKMAELGFQYDQEKAKIPAAFAAQLANTTMLGVESIRASTLSSAAQTTAITNLISYANAQITWAEKFYGTKIPPYTP